MRSFLSFVSLSCIVSLINAEPVHFNIMRSNVARDEAPAHVRDFTKRAGSVDLNVVNQSKDKTYYVQISVGTPAKQMNVVLDTSSADLWIAADSCSTCDKTTPKLTIAESSTFKANTSSKGPEKVTADTYSITGILASDLVTLGPLGAQNQPLYAVSDAGSFSLKGAVSGVLGLAWPKLASHNNTPFWKAMIDNGQASAPQMGLFISRHTNNVKASGSDPGGVFTLGGVHKDFFEGQIETHDLISQDYWSIVMKSISTNGKKITPPSGGSAAIATGQSFILGPEADVDAFYAQVPGSKKLDGANKGLYTFPCNAKLNTTLNFGGVDWPIGEGDMNLGPQTNGQCVGAISARKTATDPYPAWFIGDTFLKNVYTVLNANPPSVGFAKLSAQALAKTTDPNLVVKSDARGLSASVLPVLTAIGLSYLLL